MKSNWSDQDQLGGTLWSEIIESEDLIVPHPMKSVDYAFTEIIESEDLIVPHPMKSVDYAFTAVDHREDKKDEGATTDVRATEQTSQSENDHFYLKLENSSSIHTKEELASSRIEMDQWSDFANLSVELKDEFADGNNHSSLTVLMNDLTDATNLNSVRGDSMLLGHETDLFGHEENKDLLDCYWGTFGDFDDIEKLFRKNDSIFGHDGDGFVSASQDLINGTAQAIPMPDLPLFKDQTSDEDCTSFQLHDHSDKRRRPAQKEKVAGQKMISSPQCKSEERRKSIKSRNLKDNSNQRQHMESTDIHSSVTTPLQTSKAVSDIVDHGSSNQVTFTPHVHKDQSQNRPLCANYGVCNGDTKHQKTSNRLQDDKRETMTTQETAEKLRRLQKMRAKLAIEKQCLQYNHQNKQTLHSRTSTVTIDECCHKVPSSGLNMEEQNVTQRIPAEETIYFQLQDVITKLDVRTRLCIRDSLFCLATSAMERQNANDRSRTNKTNKDDDEISADEELGNNDRFTWFVDSEADSNPVDRMVANLLFQRPTITCPRLSSYELLGST